MALRVTRAKWIPHVTPVGLRVRAAVSCRTHGAGEGRDIVAEQVTGTKSRLQRAVGVRVVPSSLGQGGTVKLRTAWILRNEGSRNMNVESANTTGRRDGNQVSPLRATRGGDNL